MTVDVVDRDSGTVTREPLPLGSDTRDGRIDLELVPGATALQVVVRDEGRVKCWIEVPAQQRESLSVEFHCDASGSVHAFAPNRDFFVLPDEEPSKPLLLKPSTTEELDVVVLVDGTCLHPVDRQNPPVRYLLDRSDTTLTTAWEAIVKELVATFLGGSAAQKYRNVWAMAAAFADNPMPTLANVQLRPTYLVEPRIPDDRQLGVCTQRQLEDQLRQLRFSPGADFVDALADGLHACQKANWRQRSRKLLVVFGQSPGYSILDRPRRTIHDGDRIKEVDEDRTDFQLRHHCVEEEAMALHKLGVEILTIFHAPPMLDEAYAEHLPQVLAHSQRQYTQLATLREWSCFSSSESFASATATSWLEPPTVMARGPSPGLLAAKATR